MQSCSSRTTSFLDLELHIQLRICFRSSNILQFPIMTAVAHVYFGEEAFVKPGFDQIPQVGFPVSSNGLQESK